MSENPSPNGPERVRAAGGIRRRTGAVALGLALLAGCSHGPDPETALRSRPTLPEVRATYQHMLDDLHAALVPVLGEQGWGIKPASPPAGLCQEFGPQYDTRVEFMPALTFDRVVVEPEWSRVAAVTSEVIQRYGFRRPSHVVDRPDEHRLAAGDTYGADLTVEDGFGYLDFAIKTGCHLRAGAPPPVIG